MDIECVVDIRADTGECPVWSALEQVLWWTDIPGCRLYRYDPASGENRAFELPTPCGAFALRARGGLLLALKSGFFFFDPESGGLEPCGPAPFHHPDDRFNDGRTDPEGRFWVCSMRDPQDPVARAGVFFRVDPDRSLIPMVDDLVTGNGLGFSPDGRTMYMSDSNPAVQTIWAFDYDVGRGTISNRRVFVDMRPHEGRPDGAAVDAEGCYWTAANSGGRLIRFTPDGEVEREVLLPVRRPTMCCFGGSHLDEIYVTTQTPKGDESFDGQPQAGGLFRLTGLGIRGQPEPLFAG